VLNPLKGSCGEPLAAPFAGPAAELEFADQRAVLGGLVTLTPSSPPPPQPPLAQADCLWTARFIRP